MIGSRYTESCLVILKGMTNVRNTIIRNVKSGHYFLEDVTERNESTHAGGEGRVFCFFSQRGDLGL